MTPQFPVAIEMVKIGRRTAWLRQKVGGLWTTSQGGSFWTRAEAVRFLEAKCL